MGPSLSNFTISPTTLDITSSTQILSVSYRATDTSGVDPNYRLTPSINFSGNTYSFDNPFTLTSGTYFDGVFTASTTLVSVTHPPGNYTIYSTRSRDVNGKNSDYIGYQTNAVTVTSINCVGVNQSTGLDVSQTGTMQDITGDNVFSVGDRIVYTITITNSGNTTITGLNFVSTLTSGQGSYTIGDLSKYIPSQNNRSDGLIIPGGQATFSHTHTITYLDLSLIHI